MLGTHTEPWLAVTDSDGEPFLASLGNDGAPVLCGISGPVRVPPVYPLEVVAEPETKPDNELVHTLQGELGWNWQAIRSRGVPAARDVIAAVAIAVREAGYRKPDRAGI